VIPQAIIAGMSINSALGFSMMLTVLFCLGDVESVLNTATGFPFIQIFYDVTHSYAGASVMTALIMVLTMACSTGITATASRMTWSFARDQGLPFSHYLKKVNHRTKVPIVSVTVVCGLACALTLIYIGSTTAFNDVISLTVTGFYGTYFLPSAFLLYHRIKGNVLPHGTMMDGLSDAAVAAASTTANSAEKPATPVRPKSPVDKETPTSGPSQSPERDIPEKRGIRPTEYDIAQAPLIWGPWKVPGILGTINNAYACVYMLFVIFWSVWPPETPVNYTTMNYSIVVTGGVLILSGIWYFVRARKEYSGPLIDEEVAEIMHLAPAAIAATVPKTD
jgi:amino acid transporter